MSYVAPMTPPNTSWRNATLPDNTAVFAIGDIHGQCDLLKPMLGAIATKISQLPAGVSAEVIFIGDYIDRGKSAPATIDLLLDFKHRMEQTPNVKTTFLCGNHDEAFARLMHAKDITGYDVYDPADPKNPLHCVSNPQGELSLRGWMLNLTSGGGITTLRDYCPEMEGEAKALLKDYKAEGATPELIARANMIHKACVAKVSEAHKQFFDEVAANSHKIIGGYLFTHAGIDPGRTLAEQGIGGPPLQGANYFNFLMLRDPFLWRDNLPNCPYVVVHGHTPSEINATDGLIADGQKNYRLCVDTKVYDEKGGLTCFMRNGDKATFMTAYNKQPEKVIEYFIPETEQHLAPVNAQQTPSTLCNRLYEIYTGRVDNYTLSV